MHCTHPYLESHVLQEEASTIVLLVLVATASADPQSDLQSSKVRIITDQIYEQPPQPGCRRTRALTVHVACPVSSVATLKPLSSEVSWVSGAPTRLWA